MTQAVNRSRYSAAQGRSRKSDLTQHSGIHIDESLNRIVLTLATPQTFGHGRTQYYEQYKRARGALYLLPTQHNNSTVVSHAILNIRPAKFGSYIAPQKKCYTTRIHSRSLWIDIPFECVAKYPLHRCTWLAYEGVLVHKEIKVWRLRWFLGNFRTAVPLLSIIRLW